MLANIISNILVITIRELTLYVPASNKEKCTFLNVRNCVDQIKVRAQQNQSPLSDVD